MREGEMAKYEAVVELQLTRGNTVAPGEQVDSKHLGNDVQSLLEQGLIRVPGEAAQATPREAAYVSVDLALPNGGVTPDASADEYPGIPSYQEAAMADAGLTTMGKGEG